MGQFGEDLRRERVSRGIALETITDSTKISSRHLAALELDQFERLPGGVFNKGIVRGYARVGRPLYVRLPAKLHAQTGRR
jgi:cytoskeleton protein RodZ